MSFDSKVINAVENGIAKIYPPMWKDRCEMDVFTYLKGLTKKISIEI